MAKIEVQVGGKSYPCRPTMGAMLRFKKETGKEITEIAESDISDYLVYLYCCVVSACSADKVEFNMSLLEFADSVDPEAMQEWVSQMLQQPTDTSKENGQKKR